MSNTIVCLTHANGWFIFIAWKERIPQQQARAKGEHCCSVETSSTFASFLCTWPQSEALCQMTSNGLRRYPDPSLERWKEAFHPISSLYIARYIFSLSLRISSTAGLGVM